MNNLLSVLEFIEQSNREEKIIDKLYGKTDEKILYYESDVDLSSQVYIPFWERIEHTYYFVNIHIMEKNIQNDIRTNAILLYQYNQKENSIKDKKLKICQYFAEIKDLIEKNDEEKDCMQELMREAAEPKNSFFANMTTKVKIRTERLGRAVFLSILAIRLLIIYSLIEKIRYPEDSPFLRNLSFNDLLLFIQKACPLLYFEYMYLFEEKRFLLTMQKITFSPVRLASWMDAIKIITIAERLYKDVFPNDFNKPENNDGLSK